MKYRNTKDGRVVDVSSEIRGAWESLETPAPVPKKEATKPAKRKKVTE